MRRLRALHTAAILLALPVTCFAWSGSATGSVTRIDVTADGNYGVRVYLGNQVMCGAGTPQWAYLNDSDSNFNVYVSALLAAKADGDTVILYTDIDSSGNCHIGYISVQ